jgi:hypothetical protein
MKNSRKQTQGNISKFCPEKVFFFIKINRQEKRNE